MGIPISCNPRDSFRSVQGILCLFVRTEDIMDLMYVKKKIRRMKCIKEFYFYKRATNKNQLS